jgi:membrane protein DedA with SNARE-associated domain
METAMSVVVQYGAWIVFGWVFAEQIGLPILAEPVLLAAGALAGNGRLGLVSVLVAGMVGSLLADTCWYVIGRKGGRRVLGWLCRMSLEPDTCVSKTSRIFATRGARSLVVAKFIPGFNTIAPPLAGVVRMPVADFLVFSALGAAVWAGVFVGLGWMFSSQLEVVEGWIDWLGGWAIGVVAFVVVGYVAWKFIGRRRFLRRIRIARITPEELKKKLDVGEDMVVVDVRDRSEFEAEPAIIPGALHLATDELEARHHEIPRGRDIVLYCT